MIRGPSGGGKTTMLNLIGSIDSSTSGELYIMNNKID
jgi:putative ABC transport system ATP-binding protein